MIKQHGNFVAQFVAALRIGDGDLRSVILQEQSRRHPGLSQAHDQYALSVQFHAQLFEHKLLRRGLTRITRIKDNSFQLDCVNWPP
jgi:hypothetical protein